MKAVLENEAERVSPLVKHEGIGNYSLNSDRLNLMQIFKVVWLAKKQIALFTFVVTAVAAIWLINVPNTYKATTVLVSSDQENNSALSGLASQYGGLAAMAGINVSSLQGGGNQIHQAIVLLKSWTYLDHFVEKYDLKAKFLATDGWDPATDTLLYDTKLFDTKTNTWLEDEPSSFDSYKEISKKISITADDETGLITLSVSHHSPKVATEIVNILTAEINDHFRRLDQQQAAKSIEFLTEKLKVTSNTEMRQIFYRMIESHSKTLLMTEVNDQYLVKTLVAAKVPEEKYEPRRAIICIFIMILSAFFSCGFVIMRNVFNEDMQ